MEYIVFTYGTLMKGQSNHHYVINSEYLGDGVLDAYGLVETADYYPGALPMDNFRVYGEVYKVDEKTKEAMDELEEVGEIYNCIEVEVEMTGGRQKALFYEFIPDGNIRPVRLPFGKWNLKRQDLDDYLWYAVYGSNLLDERFNIYIDKTASKEKPLAQAPYTFDYPLYFAKTSLRWDDQGVAFLDTGVSGKSLGWRYLISREQFDSIRKNEGVWYDCACELGNDEYGISIFTLTASKRYPANPPSKKYLEIIAAGLLEKGLVSDAQEAKEYLGSEEDLDISAQHIQEISRNLKRQA